jgi:hypothetical protein
MTDNEPTVPEPEPETEDDKLVVLVEVESVRKGDPVEVPGLGVFKNGEAKRVTEVQIAMFNQQVGPEAQIGPDASEHHIKVPPDAPQDEPAASSEDSEDHNGELPFPPPEGTPSPDTTPQGDD